MQLKALEDAQWRKFYHCTSHLNEETMKPEQFKMLAKIIKEKKKVIKAFDHVFENFFDTKNPCLNCRLSLSDIVKATQDLANVHAGGNDEVEFQRQYQEFQAELAQLAQGQIEAMGFGAAMAQNNPTRPLVDNGIKADIEVHEVDYPNVKTVEPSQDNPAN